MTPSNGNIFRVTGHLCGEFTGPRWIPHTRPVTRSFQVFFDLCLNKPLSKQSWGWWFETLSRPFWCHCNEKWTQQNFAHILWDILQIEALKCIEIDTSYITPLAHPASITAGKWFMIKLYNIIDNQALSKCQLCHHCWHQRLSLLLSSWQPLVPPVMTKLASWQLLVSLMMMKSLDPFPHCWLSVRHRYRSTGSAPQGPLLQTQNNLSPSEAYMCW